ncbi:hypothetical protein Pmani_023885 [Petrolisthes manimaculis]|uniref:Bromo domain-containing protein n=1 Tax=Petrolisthes manimaculis TaxID=1843537 RepID=A0AAE1PBD0_9EUCA|nr:hypothetical protein Pmani_023885 [Petrolisthes manimaculis]
MNDARGFLSIERRTHGLNYFEYDLPAPVPRQDPISLTPVNGVVRPPVSAPSYRPTRNTNKLRHIELVIKKRLWEHEYSLRLREPINALEMNLPEYHNIVKWPMDLGTIKRRLQNRFYWSANECLHDFWWLFTNVYLYFKPRDPFVVTTKALERILMQELQSIPRHEIDVRFEPEP